MKSGPKSILKSPSVSYEKKKVTFSCETGDLETSCEAGTFSCETGDLETTDLKMNCTKIKKTKIGLDGEFDKNILTCKKILTQIKSNYTDEENANNTTPKSEEACTIRFFTKHKKELNDKLGKFINIKEDNTNRTWLQYLKGVSFVELSFNNYETEELKKLDSLIKNIATNNKASSSCGFSR